MIKLLKRLFGAKTPACIKADVSGSSQLRIEKVNGRYFPQKKVNGRWANILCTNELGWYKVPLFNGYSDRRNAEINIECAEKYEREAVEYYR